MAALYLGEGWVSGVIIVLLFNRRISCREFDRKLIGNCDSRAYAECPALKYITVGTLPSLKWSDECQCAN